MSREKLYSEVLAEIQAGNPMAAYSAFEKLPLPDQLGLYSVPGVGDVIASVEAGVFGSRAVDKFKQGNVLGGIGDLGITALAGASMLPVIGKFAEGVRGLGRGVQSMRQGDLFGGGGGGSRIDELNSRKQELIKDYEAMTERMPKDVARRFYPNDEINAIDEEIYSLMSTGRGVKPGSAADLERKRMSRLTEGERTNISKIQEMIQKEKNLVAARNKELISNREQMLFRLERELELEGGLVTPRTRKRMMQQIATLKKEIKDLRSKLTD
jgi:hypothetical protein